MDTRATGFERLVERRQTVPLTAAALLLAMACTATPAQAELAWRSTAEVTVAAGGADHGGHGQGHGGGHGRRGGDLYLRDGAGATLVMWTSTLQRMELAPAAADGKVAVRRSGIDNYHRLVATRSDASAEERAVRYVYMQGKPSGTSPAQLLAAADGMLEIVPAPLPREHWRYQTSRPARFLVRFGNEPLASHPVRLVTSNGTLMEERTDDEGRVAFTLPEDFARVGRGREANPPAEFIVRAVHGANGTAYRTTLSADYHANPSHWQLTWAGGLSLAAGFAFGLVLLRRMPGEGRSA